MQHRLSSNSYGSSCFSPLHAGITGAHQNAQQYYCFYTRDEETNYKKLNNLVRIISECYRYGIRTCSSVSQIIIIINLTMTIFLIIDSPSPAIFYQIRFTLFNPSTHVSNATLGPMVYLRWEGRVPGAACLHMGLHMVCGFTSVTFGMCISSSNAEATQ